MITKMELLSRPLEDISVIITSFLTHKDIIHLSLTNKYWYNLCQNEIFWQKRVIVRLPQSYHTKTISITWREWDKFWNNNHLNDKINYTLRLDSHHSYIRIITADGGIMRGSEIFQDIDILLSRAFDTGDIPLIDYFMVLYRKTIAHRKVRFVGDILSSAYTLRHALLINKKDPMIIDNHIAEIRQNYNINKDSYGCPRHLARRLGELGEVEIMDSFYLGKYMDNLRHHFIRGLIRGCHEEKAIALYKTRSEEDVDYYYIDALRANLTALQEDILSYYDDISSCVDVEGSRFIAGIRKNPHRYLTRDIVYKTYIKQKRFDEALEYLKAYHDFIYTDNVKTTYLPILAFLNEKGRNTSNSLDFKRASIDTILTALQWGKDVDGHIEMIIDQGRYDVLNIINDIPKCEDPDVMASVASDQGYKDIFLYLCILFHLDFEDIFSSDINYLNVLKNLI